MARVVCKNYRYYLNQERQRLEEKLTTTKEDKAFHITSELNRIITRRDKKVPMREFGDIRADFHYLS